MLYGVRCVDIWYALFHYIDVIDVLRDRCLMWWSNIETYVWGSKCEQTGRGSKIQYISIFCAYLQPYADMNARTIRLDEQNTGTKVLNASNQFSQQKTVSKSNMQIPKLNLTGACLSRKHVPRSNSSTHTSITKDIARLRPSSGIPNKRQQKLSLSYLSFKIWSSQMLKRVLEYLPKNVPKMPQFCR